ncbi:hypothetical protein BVG19_g1826 [[Candida] boidinii]|nr:hypothetical protein BVG19_g1826 [[Candida] boidinii]OWB53173.1 hypothetical protein B5S27_g4765 [[Candida] boidinii]
MIGVKSCLLAFSALSKLSSALPDIEVVGNKFFFADNGSQFYIRGVAYQADTALSTSNSSFVDPLADATTCKRDIPYLQQLNTNVIRVYALDATADHDECMSLLEDAGIYVLADLAQPKLSISTTDPSWDLDLFDRYTSVIDMLQGYDNILGLFAGNEVITNNTNTDSAPFVKAAIRDMKAYMKEKSYRAIPIGYSANDDADTRVASADYFACGDLDERADFYGINMYEWCGNSNFKTSGYQDRTEEFSNLTIPVFFSEYGCNEVQPRKFTEIGTIFSNEMTDVWSGGIVYMYFEEVNNYGLVSIVDDNSVSTMADYQYYSSEINDVSPTSAKASDMSSSTALLSCPATSSYWKAAQSLPPTPQDGLCNCMEASLGCIVADDVNEDDYQDLFSYVCNEVDCGGINGNGTSGKYGAYSFCSSKEKLSFVLNLYYLANSESNQACDFSGSAQVVNSSTYSQCSAVLSQAGTDGLGTVTDTVNFQATGQSAVSNTSSTGSGKTTSTSGSSGSSGSSSSASSTSSNGAGVSSIKGVESASAIISLVMSIFVLGGLSAIIM